MAKRRNNVRTLPDWVGSPKERVAQDIFGQLDVANPRVGAYNSLDQSFGLRMYLNMGTFSGILGGYISQVLGPTETSGVTGAKLTFNLVASVIDTLTAKIARIDVKPKAVTNRATAEGRELAENLNLVINGVYNKFNIQHKLVMAFRNAMISRSGFVKVVKNGDELDVELVDPQEIIIDPTDGMYNNPHKLIQIKYIPKSVMILRFPKSAKQIENAGIEDVQLPGQVEFTPCIKVIEAWCKNTYVKKGRHVICIENLALLDEEWDKDYFPVVKVDYNPPPIGSIGISVVDELQSIQEELDRLLRSQQAIIKLMAVPRIFMDVNSMVDKNLVTNRIGGFIYYDGKQGDVPQINSGSSLAPEIPKTIQFLIAQGFARVGISPLDVSGEKPAGLVSGEALQTINDIGSERWTNLKKMFEDAHVEVVKVIIRELAGTPVKLSALDDKIGLTKVSATKIPADPDSYVIQIFPASALPSDMAGKIDVVERMINMGVIPRQMAPELLSMPDTEAFRALQMAPRRYIELSIDKMLKTLDYVAPEPYDDLQAALQIASEQYNWLRINDGEESQLRLLRQYINEVMALSEQLSQKAQVQNQVMQAQAQQQIDQLKAQQSAEQAQLTEQAKIQLAAKEQQQTKPVG